MLVLLVYCFACGLLGLLFCCYGIGLLIVALLCVLCVGLVGGFVVSALVVGGLADCFGFLWGWYNIRLLVVGRFAVLFGDLVGLGFGGFGFLLGDCWV